MCVSILPIMCLFDFTQKPGLPKSPLVSNVHHPTAAVVQSLCVGVRMPVATATVCVVCRHCPNEEGEKIGGGGEKGSHSGVTRKCGIWDE